MRLSRWRGAGQGLLIGLVGGAAFGATAGLLSGDDDNCLVCFTAGEKAVILGSFLGVVGGVVGLVGGAIVGSHQIYRFGEGARQQEPRIGPSGPPGSVGGLTFAF